MFDWCAHAEARVASTAVVEDLDVLEDRVRELNACPPTSRVNSSPCIRDQNARVCADDLQRQPLAPAHREPRLSNQPEWCNRQGKLYILPSRGGRPRTCNPRFWRPSRFGSTDPFWASVRHCARQS